MELIQLTLKNNTNGVVSISQRGAFRTSWMKGHRSKEQQAMPHSVTSMCLERAKTILDRFHKEPKSRSVYVRIGEDAHPHRVSIPCSDNNDRWFNVVEIESYILEVCCDSSMLWQKGARREVEMALHYREAVCNTYGILGGKRESTSSTRRQCDRKIAATQRSVGCGGDVINASMGRVPPHKLTIPEKSATLHELDVQASVGCQRNSRRASSSGCSSKSQQVNNDGDLRLRSTTVRSSTSRTSSAGSTTASLTPPSSLSSDRLSTELGLTWAYYPSPSISISHYDSLCRRNVDFTDWHQTTPKYVPKRGSIMRSKSFQVPVPQEVGLPSLRSTIE
eukprot:3219309-Pyramimonas_sp.AAC.2